MLLLAAPADAATTCTASVNAATGPLPGSAVAPNLRLVRSFGFASSSCRALRVAARDRAGTLWAWDNGNRLWSSRDEGATWTLTHTATAYAQIHGVLALSTGRLLILVRDAAGLYRVLRSTDAGGTAFEPTPVLDLPAGARLLGSETWLEHEGAVYIGEYGDPAPPVRLWKSTDGGANFAPVYALPDVRHFHTVQADPYVAGRIWVTIGDNGAAPRVGYSDDGGRNFTFVSQGRYPESRAVALMFTRDAVYWGTDVPEQPGVLFRWDRATRAVTPVLTGLNGAYYYAFQHEGTFAQLSAVSTAGEGYVGDEHIHVLTSNGGTGWSATRTPFTRDPAYGTGANTVVLGHTRPDAQGRFWVSFWNVTGSQDRTSNVQFQLDPRVTFDGASPAFSPAPPAARVREPVAVDGTGSTSPAGGIAHVWDWGDGTPRETGATAGHRYGAEGVFPLRLQVTDAAGTRAEAVRPVAIASGAAAPGATTEPPGPAPATGATLRGLVAPNGSETTVRFEYGTGESYGSSTPAVAVGDGRVYAPHEATVENLRSGVTYHYRVVATSPAGTTYGANRVVRTAPAPPTVETRAAEGVTDEAATVRAAVNPNGDATTVRFEYGPTDALGEVTAPQDAGGGTSDHTLEATLDRLMPATTYRYRAVASNAAGTTSGEIRTFTTQAPRPSATTEPATGVTAAAATLNATVDPQGSPASVHFEYGPTPAYGSRTATQPADAAGPVSAALDGLPSSTTYHYRVVATSAAGTRYGSDRTFTTTVGPPRATTEAAGGVGEQDATLNATVDTRGQAATVHFEYGTTSAYGEQTPAQALPGNLVANPGFETGTQGWTTAANGGLPRLSRDTGWAGEGNASGRLETGELPAGGWSEARVSPAVGGIEAGQVYEGRVRLDVRRLAPGQAAVLYITWRSDTGASLGKARLARTTATGTQTLAGAVTVPPGPVAAQPVVTVENAGTAEVGIDDVRFHLAGAGAPRAVSAAAAQLRPGTEYHYRVVATSAAGTTQGSDRTFTTRPPPSPPVVSDVAASAVEPTSATFSGSVDPRGLATTYRFEHRPAGVAGWTATPTGDAGSGSAPRAVSAGVSGLQPTTTYQLRLVATNSAGSSAGDPVTFATPGVPPSATTGVATAIDGSSATLTATVDPRGSTTSARFEYGPGGVFDSWTPLRTLEAASGSTALTERLSGLLPNTAYEYRAVAGNTWGTVTGATRSFTTAPIPPNVAILGAHRLGGTRVELRGSVNPNRAATTWRFAWGTTTAYENATPVQSAGSGALDVGVAAVIDKLRKGTVYHARLVATNAGGTAHSPNLTFTVDGSGTAKTLQASTSTLSGGVLSVPVRCARAGGCSGRVRVERGRELLVRTRFALRRRRGVVRVALRRPRSGMLTITVRARDPHGWARVRTESLLVRP